jgi:hypothetical protein
MPDEKPSESQQSDDKRKEQREYEKELYRAYVEEKRDRDKAALEVTARYTQWVLTLSAGALAVSLAFLEKIVPEPAAWTLPLLLFAWVALVAALLGGFLAVHYSCEATMHARELVDFEYHTERRKKDPTQPEPKYVERENPWNPKTERCSELASWSLVAGVLLLCIFAFCNVAWKTARREKQQPPQRIELSIKPNGKEHRHGREQ